MSPRTLQYHASEHLGPFGELTAGADTVEWQKFWLFMVT